METFCPVAHTYHLIRTKVIDFYSEHSSNNEFQQRGICSKIKKYTYDFCDTN
jgi:hypothetical protein